MQKLDLGEEEAKRRAVRLVGDRVFCMFLDKEEVKRRVARLLVDCVVHVLLIFRVLTSVTLEQRL